MNDKYRKKTLKTFWQEEKWECITEFDNPNEACSKDLSDISFFKLFQNKKLRLSKKISLIPRIVKE